MTLDETGLDREHEHGRRRQSMCADAELKWAEPNQATMTMAGRMPPLSIDGDGDRSTADNESAPATVDSLLAASNPARDAALRTLDIVGSTLLLTVLLPLYLLIAAAVCLDSRGPALFVQKRVGRHGREFDCYKFRSMRPMAETFRFALSDKNERGDGSVPVFKMRNDPRVTRVGRWLRRSSMDELPQLINVLKGDMSLVGPRPGLPSEVEHYTTRHRERLSVPPGLTGLWQVSGRANIPFDAMIELDLSYIRDRSLWMNIRILALTIPAVLLARGAY